MPKPVETGEIHFFYRTKLDVEQPSNTDDLQRVFLALVPEGAKHARLFVIGRKQLPEIIAGKSHPTERNWLLLTMVDRPAAIGKALRPERYETETRGERVTAEAIPVGSGRYAIVPHHGSTQLAWRLVSPERAGKAQKELRIEEEARYVIAVKNPSVKVPGFPDEEPDYPKDLADKFADERWIDISDPRLLDYENAQCLLIGARKDIAPLEIDLDGEADPFVTFGLDADKWPNEPLKQGAFAEPERAAEPVETDTDRSKGGKRGGTAAAETDSAAGVASALKEVSLPTDRSGLAQHAQGNGAAEEVVALIKRLPDWKFETMADVMKAVGEVR